LDGVSALYRSGRRIGTRREGDRNPWPHSCVSGRHDARESARSRCAMCNANTIRDQIGAEQPFDGRRSVQILLRNPEQRRLKSGVNKSQTPGSA